MARCDKDGNMKDVYRQIFGKTPVIGFVVITGAGREIKAVLTEDKKSIEMKINSYVEYFSKQNAQEFIDNFQKVVNNLPDIE